MIYVNDYYISNKYKYLVDYSDNYIVLTNSSSVEGDYMSPDTINCVVQYFSPSTAVFEYNRTFYNSQSFTNVSDYITSDKVFMRDWLALISVSLFIVICLTFIFNGLTRLIHKGGLVFPK